MISAEHSSGDEPDDDLDQETAEETQNCTGGNQGDDHRWTSLVRGVRRRWLMVSGHVDSSPLHDRLQESEARIRPDQDLPR